MTTTSIGPSSLDRRKMVLSTLGGAGALAATLTAGTAQAAPAKAGASTLARRNHHTSQTEGNILIKDGTRIFYKSWGTGPAVVLSHGWVQTGDSWESVAMFLAMNGFRVIAHDRRGHGRSSQPWNGNDMDTFASDLATVINDLELKQAALFGFSMGAGEVARYIGRYGSGRISKLGLISGIPPLMLKTPGNPAGTPKAVFDGIRAQSLANRVQLYRDFVSGPVYGFNRANAKVSQGLIDSFLYQALQSGHKNAFDCIQAFSETDFTADLAKFNRPTLIVHGEEDQIVPIEASARAAARLIPSATLKVYEGAPHGIPETHKERLNADILAFLKA